MPYHAQMIWDGVVNCPDPGFDAAITAASHAGLAGVLAGFALAATVLNIELRRDNQARPMETLASLFSFAAFLIGTLTAFMYSASSGDPQCVAFVGFTMHGSLFLAQVAFLLVSLTLLLSSREPTVARAATSGTLAGVVFGFSQLWFDVANAMDLYAAASSQKTLLLLVGAAFGVSFTVLVLAKSTRRPALPRLRHLMTRPASRPGRLVAVAIGFSFVIAAFNGGVVRADGESFPHGVALGALTMVGVVLLWISTFLPDLVRARSSSAG